MKYYADPKHNKDVLNEGISKILLEFFGSNSLMGLAVTQGTQMAVCYTNSVVDISQVLTLEGSQMLSAAFKLAAVCKTIKAELEKNDEYLTNLDSYGRRRLLDAACKFEDQSQTHFDITPPSNPRDMYFERAIEMMLIPLFKEFKEHVRVLPADLPSMPAYKDSRDVIYAEFGL